MITKKMLRSSLLSALFTLPATALWASEPAAEAVKTTVSAGAGGFFTGCAVAVAVGLGLAAAGCGIGMGSAVSGAVQGISRQPQATDKIQMNMILGLAFIESLVLYTLFIAIILLFANPFTKFFVS